MVNNFQGLASDAVTENHILQISEAQAEQNVTFSHYFACFGHIIISLFSNMFPALHFDYFLKPCSFQELAEELLDLFNTEDDNLMDIHLQQFLNSYNVSV